MASLWNRSGMVERYADDLRADGAKAYFFNGGTTTPLTVFQDSSQSSAHPHPVVADANGRWPDVFVPFIISYDVRVTSKDDVQLTFSVRIPNPDPVEQTVIVPPERQIQTGMIHPEFVPGTVTKPGYVRLNGKTIGSTASGAAATERGNDDTLDLYVYLWNNVSQAMAPVSGGRGSSGASDFANNKVMGLPDMRAAGFAGLDDMGNLALGGFGSLTFNVGNSILAASSIGVNTITLSQDNMPPHTHTGSTDTDGTHSHNVSVSTVSTATTGSDGGHSHTGNIGDPGHVHGNLKTDQGFAPGGAGAIVLSAGPQLKDTQPAGTGVTFGSNAPAYNDTLTSAVAAHTHPIGNLASSGTASSTGSGHSHAFTTNSRGGLGGVAVAFNNMPITRLVTWFIKL